MARSKDEADQIVFRWDSENEAGSTGFGPVAWSGPRDEVEALFRIYGTLLRANGEETRPALLRVEQLAGVVLVRRTPVREAGRRESVVCHALVGSAELLDPAFCLGLHAWDWDGAELPSGLVRGALPVVPREVLAASAGTGQRALDRALPRVEPELTGAVAELLRHPQARFTLLDERGDTACPVLRGLHGMFGAVPRPRRWTFASHDTAELTSLRFVFVGQWSGAASRNTERRRVDPRERVGDRAEELAARLVHHHVRGGPENPVATALREVPGAGDLPLMERAERAVQRLDGTAATSALARRTDTWEPESDADAPSHGDAWTARPAAPQARRAQDPYAPGRNASGPYAPDPYAPATGTGGLYCEAPTPPEAPPREVPSPHRETSDGPPAPPHEPPRQTPSLYRDVPAAPPREVPGRQSTPPREAAVPAGGPQVPPVPVPVAVVPPVWRGPEGGRGRWRSVRSWRGRGRPVETGLVQWVADGTADAARIRAGGDAELLAALRGRGPYPVTTLLMHEVARRLPTWPPPLRRAFRDLVLAGELFVTAPGSALPGEPTEAERAANAAALHRWAVRPLLDEGDAPAAGVLVALLTRLRTSDVPAARGAYRQIVEGERPGLPEEVWQALLHEADTAPHPPPPPVADPEAYPAANPASGTAPAAPAPAPAPPPPHPAPVPPSPTHPAPVPPSPTPPAPKPSASTPPASTPLASTTPASTPSREASDGDARLVAMALVAVIVTLLAVIVAYSVT